MDNALTKKLFYEMLRLRLVEEKIAELYPEEQMRCPVHLYTGQEAVAVGVCANLQRDDYVMSHHRSHGHYLAKGGNLNAMMAEIYGKETGCSKGKGGSMHLVDLSVGFMGATPIVGSTIPIAAGLALSVQMKKEKRATVIFLGDAATEEGVFHETVNFAVLKNLPIVFICENNFYSVNSPLSVRQPKGREIYRLVAGNNIPVRKGDGNDVNQVYELTKEAIQKAREGGGPAFFEFTTYRFREHCGHTYDHPAGLRQTKEVEEWMKNCPIEQFKKILIEKKLLDEKELKEMTAQINQEIKEAVSFAKESPFPKEELLLNDVYAS